MIGQRLALAGAFMAALMLAACGDSTDSTDQTEPAATPAATPAPVAATTVPASTPAPAPTVTTIPPPAPVVPATPAIVPAAPAAAPPATTPALAPAATPAVTPAATETPTPTPAVAAEPAAAPATPPVAAVLPPEVAALVGPPPEPAATPAAPDATLEQRLAAANPDEGAVYLMQCEICHTVEQGGPAKIGPNLFAIVGAPVGHDLAFSYSPAFVALRETGATWTPERLDAFLAAPGAEIPGTRMGFGGFDDPDTRANVIAWLATLVPVVGEEPVAPQVVGVQMPGLDPVTFVAVQADVGADQYVSLGCGSCHGAEMHGGVGPALVGPEFAARWFARPVSDLMTALRTMPPNSPGTLPDGRYIELLVAILVANGFEPGSAPLRNNPAALQTIGFYQPAARQGR